MPSFETPRWARLWSRRWARPLLACLATVSLLFVPRLLDASRDLARASSSQGNSKCCAYDIVGHVWNDLNTNGVDDSEPPLAQWGISVFDVTAGAYAAGALTDNQGNYSIFTPAPCGNIIRVTLVLPPNWTQTAPVNPPSYTFQAGGCAVQIPDIDFGAAEGFCPDFMKTYTLDADFGLGDLNGVQAIGDQLELTPKGTTFGFAWIANSSEGTLSKVDLASGNEVARYFTGPPNPVTGSYGALDPSRTAVDEDGNCWVLNRVFDGSGSSVTQILATGGVDRNTNTTIETSQDSNNDGVIQPTEMLPFGADERVARHYKVGGVFPDDLGRALALDKAGFLWVGLYNGQRCVKLDPNLSTVTYAPHPTIQNAPPTLASVSTAPHRPYGLALSPSGMLYGATHGSTAFEIDPGVASGGTSAGPVMTQFINHSGNNYGIAVDQDCIVWLAMQVIPTGSVYPGCTRWDPAQNPGNPLLGWSYSNPGAPGEPRGITVDFDGFVWLACNDTGSSIAKYAPTDPPTYIASYPTGTHFPVGVGVASDENIIVVSSGTPAWEKRNHQTGVNIPLAGPQQAGSYPYTYSDFTGSLFSLVNKQQGVWTVISDAGAPNMRWVEVSWNQVLPPAPPNTAVTVEIRVASSLGGLPSQSWQPVLASGLLPTPLSGRYMETRVRLVRDIECGLGFVTPVLEDLTVRAECECALGPCEPVIAECESPLGAVVAYAPPTLDASCDEGAPVICTPPSGTLFPMGTTTVNCWTLDAQGDTIRCSFPVTVVGECDAGVQGGCCINGNCLVLTEAQCDAISGLYLGDDSDCSVGCGFSCQRPPRGMTAWFPLDGAPGGVTPNLADFGSGAVQNGSPLLQGGWVTASYSFDRSAQSQWFQAPHTPRLDVFGGDFSIDVWVKTTFDLPSINPILDKRVDDNEQGYHLFLSGGYPGLQIAVNGTAHNMMLSAASGPAAFVADGQWHLIAVTVDRDQPNGTRFYVDGQFVGPALDPTSVQGNIANAADLLIGKRYQIGVVAESWFEGSLDEIEIFRRVVDAEEILDIYNAGVSGKCREACYVPQYVNFCGTTSVNTAITICNYDSQPHLYSWGLSGTSAGFSTAISSFTPAFGSVTVPAGTCVSVPVTLQVPTGMSNGQTAGFQVSVLNHDSGRLFGCVGSARKNQWWCIQATDDSGAVDVGPMFAVNALQGGSAKITVAHLTTSDPGPVFDYTLKVVTEDGSTPSQNVSLNGAPPGDSVSGFLPWPPLDEVGEIPVFLELIEHTPLQFDKLQVWSDDDMDGQEDLIAELGIRSTLGSVTGTGETPELAKRAFRSVPNPFNPVTEIIFEVKGSSPQPVDLRVFDMRGRKVKTIYSMEQIEPGVHRVVWDGRDKRGARVASGVYVLQLSMPGVAETVKTTLVK